MGDKGFKPIEGHSEALSESRVFAPMEGPSAKSVAKFESSRLLEKRHRLSELKQKLPAPKKEDPKSTLKPLTPEEKELVVKLLLESDKKGEDNYFLEAFKSEKFILKYSANGGWRDQYEQYRVNDRSKYGPVSEEDYVLAKGIEYINSQRDQIIGQRLDDFLHVSVSDDPKTKEKNDKIKVGTLDFIYQNEDQLTDFYGLNLNNLDEKQTDKLQNLKQIFFETVFKFNGYSENDQDQIDKLFADILSDVLSAFKATLQLQEQIQSLVQQAQPEQPKVTQPLAGAVSLGIDSKASTGTEITNVLNTGVTFKPVQGKGNDVYEIRYDVKGEQTYRPLVQISWNGRAGDLDHAKFFIQEHYIDSGTASDSKIDGVSALSVDKNDLPTALNFLVLDDYLNRKRKEDPAITSTIPNPNEIINDHDLLFIAEKLLPHFNSQKLGTEDMVIFREFLKLVLRDKEQGSLIVKMKMIKDTLENDAFAYHMRFLLSDKIRSEDRPKSVRELIESARHFESGIKIDAGK